MCFLLTQEGCIGAVFGCTGVVFGCTGVAFGCTGLAFGCTGIAFGCSGIAFGCTGVEYAIHAVFAAHSWLAGRPESRQYAQGVVTGRSPGPTCHMPDGYIEHAQYKIQS